MAAMLTSPPLVGSRDLAREFLAELPSDMSRAELVIDCALIEASAPSFVDELVKVVLQEARAKRLTLSAAPVRMARYAERSAANRGVADRLRVEVRELA